MEDYLLATAVDDLERCLDAFRILVKIVRLVEFEIRTYIHASSEILFICTSLRTVRMYVLNVLYILHICAVCTVYNIYDVCTVYNMCCLYCIYMYVS